MNDQYTHILQYTEANSEVLEKTAQNERGRQQWYFETFSVRDTEEREVGLIDNPQVNTRPHIKSSKNDTNERIKTPTGSRRSAAVSVLN